MSMNDVHHVPIAENCDNYDGLTVKSTNGACHRLASIDHKFSCVTKRNSQGMSATTVSWTCIACLAHKDLGKQFHLDEVE